MNMRVVFGDVQPSRTERAGPAEWDFGRTINPHCIILGDSGSGKTHNLRRMISQMVQTGDGQVRVHVIDSHGDIDIAGASAVRFSESTDFGFNPLIVSPHPDYGGVRKRIQSFIGAISRTSWSLGPKQVNVLRNLLLDVYAMYGFNPDDPGTWVVSPAVSSPPDNGRTYLEVPFEEKEQAKVAGAMWDVGERAWFVAEGKHEGKLLRWGPKQFGKRYPTVLDVLRFARNKLQAMKFGANQQAMRLLDDVTRLTRQLRAKEQLAMRRAEEPDAGKLQADLDTAKRKAIEAYSDCVLATRSGRELEEWIKYDSPEVLKSIIDRLDNLVGSGTVRSTEPPFHPRSPVWRYEIGALLEDEKKLFTMFRLEALFAEAKQRGPSDRVTEVIIIDEADLYTSDDPEHILNKIIKEARKFGIALVMASQAPQHFSENMLAGVAVRVFIGLDKLYWSIAIKKFGVDEASLDSIVPWESCVVQTKNKGEKGVRSQRVRFSNVRS